MYKTEVIGQLEPWYSMTHVEIEAFAWVDWFNNCRLLEPIENIPPAESKELYNQTQNTPVTVAGLT